MSRQMMVILAVVLCAFAFGGYKLGFTGNSGGGELSTVLGWDTEGNWAWDESDGTYSAFGEITIGGVFFKDADLVYDDDTGVLSGTASTKIKFADGCNIKSSSEGHMNVEIASGADILDLFPDAPVDEGYNYFYLRSDSFTTFKCMEYEGNIWNDDEPTEFFYSPDDSGFYASVGDVLSVSPLLAMATGGKLKPFSIDRLTIGVSESGVLPWESEIADEQDELTSFNAHVLIGGDFKVPVQGVAVSVRDGEAAFRFTPDALIRRACVTGDLALADYDWPFLDEALEFELPLGQGIACLEDNELLVHADVNMSDWEDLDVLPDVLRDMINDMGAQEAEVNGWIDLDSGDFEFRITQDWPTFGFFDIEGDLLVSSDGMGLSGECAMDLGPVSFGDVTFQGDFTDRNLNLTGAADVSLPGFSGAGLEADFRVNKSGAAADLNVVLWGWVLEGSVSYSGYDFSIASFDVGFDWVVVAGDLQLTVTGADPPWPLESNTLSVRVSGHVLGIPMAVAVDSSGCFYVSVVVYEGEFCF